MKKRFLMILVALCVFAGSAFATNWFEAYTKGYIDLDSLKFDGPYVFAWVKQLNDGDWKPQNGQKIHYKMIYYVADCESRKVDIIAGATYNLNKTVVDSFDISSNYNPYSKYNDWRAVVPDSIMEVNYNMLCYCRNLYINKQNSSN